MTIAGKVVEYVDHGKFICGLVMEEADKKYRLINQNGREVKLPQARILHQSSFSLPVNLAKEEIQRRLQEVDQLRRQCMTSVNLFEIWQLASEEADFAFDPAFLAELSFGEKVTDDHVAAFLRCVFIDRLFFKYKEGRIVAHAAEVVEQLRLREDEEQRLEELYTRGAEALIAVSEGRESDWPGLNDLLAMVRDYYLFGNESAQSDTARELLKKAGLTRPHDVFHLLVKAGRWQPDENIPLLRYSLPMEFSAEAEAQTAALSEPDLEVLLTGRKDFRHLPLITIDGAETRDFDDALHVEKKGDHYLVGVHIADVASYVKPGTPLFNEAESRCTSIYFHDSRVPMLPTRISEDICSLIEGKPRAALSFMIELSAVGEVLNFDCYSSVVEVARRISYDDADQISQTDDEIALLAMLSDKIKERRIHDGALIIPIPDVNVKVADGDSITIEISEVDTLSRSLVAEFMVLANTLGAGFVADREAPGLFRSQEPPNKRLAAGYVKDLYVNFRQRRFLKPAKLLTKPKPHSCVGVMHYTTMTSPIRRFVDLVMQHQVLSLLRSRAILFQDKELNVFIAEIITKQSRVNLVRRLRHRYWLLKYLHGKVGQRLEAMVIDIGPKRVNVVILECLMEADLPPNPAIHKGPGDKVMVLIAKASPLDDLLRLEW